MEKIELLKILNDYQRVVATKDKKEWGDGEWINEPDEYDDSYKGYSYYIWRNSAGSLCGYVKIPNDSKWALIGKEDYMDLDDHFEVHGGITFASENSPKDGTQDQDFYWIGFDCAHWDDKKPAYEYLNIVWSQISPLNCSEQYSGSKKIYRNLEYVKKECEKLIDQIIEKSDGK